MSGLPVKPQPIVLFDQAHDDAQIQRLETLAFGEAVLHSLDRFETGMALYFWPLEEVVYLGMMDLKLPFLQEAVAYLRRVGVQPIVRSAGGLAVVSDTGVLNLTVWVNDQEQTYSIDQGYELVKQFVNQAFPELASRIKAVEIPDSYCPGAYDLSVDGKKFAGMAQRRYKGTIGISIYMSVKGDQIKRGELIRAFYEQGLQGADVQWSYPKVRPSSMATLSELLEQPLAIDDVKQRIERALVSGGYPLRPMPICAVDTTALKNAYERLQKRNAVLEMS